ncbi:MAG: NAD-dependent epimerase/dehydratase family protein, partial [Ignavibacteriae bacterium]|nr:NAD-dependent epimerase/dehydratase family protein [Ignavibacteriota bacterium]
MIKKRILLIGSNGMLGQCVVENLRNRNDIELTLASAEDTSFFDNISYSKLDISNKKEVKKIVLDFYPDYIINVAA